MLHGDGDIFLVYYEKNNERFCYVVMQSDIACSEQFSGSLPKQKYYDWETPYGYGGPLTDTPISDETQLAFKKEIEAYCREHNIVSQFVRFHPLLRNYDVLPLIIETRYLRDTIFMVTNNPEQIMADMDSKNRNMVRKAQKNGVTIVKKEISDVEDFISMYNETMQKNDAEEYYTFQKSYFDSLTTMQDNAFVLYAMYEDIPISGSIMYYNDRYMHYHLSGSRTEYRKFSPSNLLLYEAACWASENGIKQFHLGGGMAPDDSLFGFKKQFNKNGRASFVVGRTVFDQEAYEKLLNVREDKDPEFNRDNGFMIQYRR